MSWPVLIILTAASLGFVSTIVFLKLDKYRGIKFPFLWLSIFPSAILLILLFPTRWWSLTIGFIVSVLALPPLLNAIDVLRDNIRERRQDRANAGKVPLTKAIGEARRKEQAQDLIAALGHSNSSTRLEAAVDLHQYPGEATVSALIAALAYGDAEVRAATAESLRLLRDPRAVQPLIQVLESDTEHTPVYNAIRALGYIRTPESIAALVSALDHGKGDTSALAFELGEARAVAGVDALIRLLQNGTAYERKQAVTALARIGDSRALEPLARTLEDPDDTVRERVRSVTEGPSRRLWCAICGDWADASFSQEEPRTCAQCRKENVTEMDLPFRFRRLDADGKTVASEQTKPEDVTSDHYVNLAQGSTVPVSGKYKCAWCGVLTVVNGGSAQSFATAGQQAQLRQRFPTERSFKAGELFSMCHSCGPATGWTLIK